MVAVTLASLVAGLADVIGGWFTLRLARLRGELDQLMALGGGFLLGTALLIMLPAAARAPGGPPMLTLGFAAFLVFRALFTRGRQGAGGPNGHGSSGDLGADSAWAVFGGMLLHSLIEGLALGLAVQVGGQVGWIALTAMALHKLSEGFSLATVVLSTSRSTRLTLLAVSVVGLMTVLGGWVALLGSRASLLSEGAVLAVTAGSFLYVGATEILPHLLRKRGTLWLVLAGMLMVYLLTGNRGLIPGHVH